MLLKTIDLDVFYSNIQALKGISFEMEESRILSIIGSNGVGKTTILKTIMGLKSPERGKILFSTRGEKREIQGLPSYVVASMGVTYIPEGRQILTRLTVKENLLMGAYTVENKTRIREQLENMFNRFPILRERENQIAITLSGGQQQMLAIARALMSYPTLILMDEPSLGLAPKLIKYLFELIMEFKKEKKSIILVEQNAVQALRVCDKAYVMQEGRFVLSGEPNELLQNNLVKETYLGG
jgi:branched-chain amino acid transport system ATP-binding protein